LPHYESETESEESEEDGIPSNKKQKRDHYEWTIVECKDPNSALLNEACWIIATTAFGQYGKKVYYKCRLGSKWRTLEELFECDFSVWLIENLSRDNVFNATCSCKRSLKVHLCKHILGLAGRLGYVKFPAMAKNIPIGQKRKRGRPSKCKKALIRQ
jgi:hypothetical protein